MRDSYTKLRKMLRAAWTGVMGTGAYSEADSFLAEDTHFWFPVVQFPELEIEGVPVLLRIVSKNVRKYSKAEKEAGGWFPLTQEDMDGFSIGQQTKWLKRLEELGYIERERRGLPASRYVRVDYDKVLEALGVAVEA